MLTDPDMAEIFESFVVETKETLEKLDLDLVKLESTPDDADLLNEIFRSFHTVKGTSGFLGLVKMQELTHRLEDILNKLRKGEAKVSSTIMDGILSGYDALSELLVIIEENKNEEFETENEIKSLEKIIKNIESGEVIDTGSENNVEENEIVKDPYEMDEEELAQAFLNNNKKFMEDNSSNSFIKNEDVAVTDNEHNEEKNIETTVVKSDLAIEKNNKEKPNRNYSTEKSASKTKDDKKQNNTLAEQTIRVEVERLDELLNLVSELVLGRNRLAQLNSDVSVQYEGTEISRNLGDTARQIDLLTTELQLAVMKTRMIKIEKVFNRFPRLVRDLSKETGKEINLEIFGEKTELDKTLIEEINDPLVHLIRNSVDHGVETPEERKKNGKPEKGTITLSAE
ncbi:MAG: Hpt domain-containing protein, partial [Ignavibacteriae bacterium]|nr:Hpt domain-containing protein [Ignavibacteriota bacterium]